MYSYVRVDWSTENGVSTCCKCLVSVHHQEHLWFSSKIIRGGLLWSKHTLVSCPPGEWQFTKMLALARITTSGTPGQREAEWPVTEIHTRLQTRNHTLQNDTDPNLVKYASRKRVMAKYIGEHFVNLQGFFIAGYLRTFNQLMCLVSLPGSCGSFPNYFCRESLFLFFKESWYTLNNRMANNKKYSTKCSFGGGQKVSWNPPLKDLGVALLVIS